MLHLLALVAPAVEQPELPVFRAAPNQQWRPGGSQYFEHGRVLYSRSSRSSSSSSSSCSAPSTCRVSGLPCGNDTTYNTGYPTYGDTPEDSDRTTCSIWVDSNVCGCTSGDYCYGECDCYEDGSTTCTVFTVMAIAIPVIFILCCCSGFAVFFKMMRARRARFAVSPPMQNSVALNPTAHPPAAGYPAGMAVPAGLAALAGPSAMPVAMAQPAMQQMMVTVPPGSKSGDTIAVTSPSGAAMQVVVPAGVNAGGQFQVNMPAAPAVAQAVPVAGPVVVAGTLA